MIFLLGSLSFLEFFFNLRVVTNWRLKSFQFLSRLEELPIHWGAAERVTYLMQTKLWYGTILPCISRMATQFKYKLNPVMYIFLCTHRCIKKETCTLNDTSKPRLQRYCTAPSPSVRGQWFPLKQTSYYSCRIYLYYLIGSKYGIRNIHIVQSQPRVHGGDKNQCYQTTVVVK